MSESVTIKGTAGVENLEESMPNGNTPALTVSANYEHGVLDIDLGGYSHVGHTHDEYVKKGEEQNTGLRCDTIFTGNANSINKAYTLSKPITDYKYLLIFGAAYNEGAGKFVQRNSMLVDVNDIEYSDQFCGWTVVFQDGRAIGGTFTDNKTFKINIYSPGAWQYVTVRKIVGIY